MDSALTKARQLLDKADEYIGDGSQRHTEWAIEVRKLADSYIALHTAEVDFQRLKMDRIQGVKD